MNRKHISIVLASILVLWQGPTLMSVKRLQGGSAGRVIIDNGTNGVWNAVSGDGSITSGGVWTNSKINGNSFPSSVASGDTFYGSGTSAISKLGIGSTGNVLTVSGGLPSWSAPATSGTVTSFSAGNFSPLFTTGVATSSSTPTLSFAAISQAANSIYAGPSSGPSAAPTFRGLVPLDWAASASTGALPFASSGTANSWLGIGSTNQVLTVSAGLPSWQTWSTGLPAAGTAGRMVYDNGSSYVATTAGADGQTIRFSGTVPSPSSVLTNDGTGVTIAPTSTNKALAIAAGTGSNALAAVTISNSAALGIQITNSASAASNAGSLISLGSAVTTANGQRLGGLTFTYSGATNAAATIDALSEEGNGTGNGGRLRLNTAATGTTNAVTSRVDIRGLGDVSLNASGSALATNATSGFTWLPTCAGVPTGAPTYSYTGAAPFVLDATDNRLYSRVGSGWTNLTPNSSSFVTSAGGSVTLTSAQIPGLFVGTNGVGMVLNLPAANSVGVCDLRIVAQGSSFITVTRAGSDTINSATTLTVTSGHSAVITSNNSNAWFVIATS